MPYLTQTPTLGTAPHSPPYPPVSHEAHHEHTRLPPPRGPLGLRPRPLFGMDGFDRTRGFVESLHLPTPLDEATDLLLTEATMTEIEEPKPAGAREPGMEI